ncbi:hypothetical protein OROMI_010254 [Orobanche minor]
MLREDDKDQAPGKSRRTYSRSVSWSERRKSACSPQWNSKARACLPPLQPLSIIRPNIEDWPKAGSDDLGIWPNPPTPGAKPKSLTPRESSNSDREFEFRKDKLAFFDMECSKILDHIYLGSDAIAKNRETLRQNGITHVLNCVGFSCPEYFKNELVYKTLWLQDCPSEDITSILYDTFDYFEDVCEQGGRVFVHCCHGVSRSTSLVIAYLMWKNGQSFDDAFEFVKKVRGVTNPNVGFACQLLQCQKRLHAQPESPSSILRMYRMAPHSPYDPLHLVPKMLCEPGPHRIDSRGAFIVHVPFAFYVWIGKHCSLVMSENAKAAAIQVVRYERAKGPVITIKEGDETFAFWDAFRCNENNSAEKANTCLGLRKLDEYDLDFEIFHRALSGGVVPPFPLSEAGPETCLPVRENGWNRFSRKKYVNGIMKEFNTSFTADSDEKDLCVDDVPSPSSSPCNSSGSFASYLTSSPCWTRNNLTRSKSLNLVESFSSLSMSSSKPHGGSTSPSVSPSNSDCSSSFTFSRSSSNRSDLSFVSAQSSSYAAESKDTTTADTLEKSVGFVDEETSSPFLTERRGMILLPSIDEASQISENL